MKRVKFTVTYDGRHFSGWQIQPGVASIQESLESAFQTIFDQPFRIHGSGRTDAGVHALGQVFHIDVPDTCTIPEEKWPAALNTRLPGSVRILNATYVDNSFHARFSATKKTYRYVLSLSPIFDPFDRGIVWYEPRPLNIETMEKGMREFQGNHDFRAFAALRGNEPDPIPLDHFRRTIFNSELTTQENRLILTFSGSGFLYKMVRLMTGAIHHLGTGRLPYNEFADLIHRPEGKKSPLCAPSDGLYLVSVDYE